MTGGDAGLRLWAGAGALLVAAAMSAVLILLLLPVLRRHALARPNARSSHHQPTPQGGGIAVIAATILVTVGAAALGEMHAAATAEVFTVLAGSALLAVVGGIDDVRPLPVAPRLLLQTLAIALAIAAMPSEVRIVASVPWWAERLGLLLGLLWFVNLVNFMDGIDWMTVAEAVPLTAGVVLLGQMATLPLPSTVLALALLGAVLGFAPFNKPVARLFVGDVGSLPIGLLLGWLLLQLARAGAPAAALLLPLYYLADATVTLLRRVAAGEPFWQAHRSHFYQRAGDHGFSVADIVRRVFATNVLLAGLAFVTVARPGTAIDVGSLLIGTALVAGLLFAFARKKR